jgi:hypothetical protein
MPISPPLPDHTEPTPATTDDIAHFNTGIITYSPADHVRNLRWDSPLDVLSYLLLKPSDRDRLRNEATRQSPYENRGYFVYHPLLGYRLWITSFDTDQQFVQTMHTLFFSIKLEREILSAEPPPTFLHTEHILIRDPHGMIEDPLALALLLTPFYHIPHEVLILMRGGRATPLYS